MSIAFPDNIHQAVVKRKAEFLAGRYCAQRALAEIDIEATTLAIGKDRYPEWPESALGSISHSDSRAVAIVSKASDLRGIGIDIEKHINENTIENIQSQILFGTEVDLLSATLLSKQLFFTIVFSLKESFFKSAYPIVQSYFDFDAITVTHINVDTGSIMFTLNCELHNTLQKGRVLHGQFARVDNEHIATFTAIR